MEASILFVSLDKTLQYMSIKTYAMTKNNFSIGLAGIKESICDTKN
jgi:hypothetical protein